MSSKITTSPQAEFGPIRGKLWPIHNYELKKFVPLGLIMFCILFNYTLLRDTKDTLVVNAAGAEVISFLKLFCVTPGAILFVIIYAKLTNVMSNEKVFYTVVTPFLVFFGLFAFAMYPNLDVLHTPADVIAAQTAAYPKLAGFINIKSYWCYSLFYVLSEIWGSAMIALMFWSFANQIVRMSESKRFYGLFVVVGNVALILSGQVVKFCSQTIKNFYPTLTDAEIWGISLNWLMGSIVIMGIGAMMLYRWMHTDVLTDPRFYDEEQKNKVKKKKEKPSIIESCKIIAKSPELGLIAMLVIAYGISINLVEVQWKHQLKMYFAGDKGAYNGFMGDFSTWTGLATIIFSFFVGSNMLRRFSWTKAAMVTPLIIILGGAGFFSFILANDIPFIQGGVMSMLAVIGTNPITAAAFLGMGIVMISKAIKYSLFDPTKEMAYLPLGEEHKTKGKAAVDVIGARLGKAGGSGVYVLMFTYIISDTLAVAPYAMGIFFVICAGWLISVKALGKRVNTAQERQRVEQEAKSKTISGGQPAAQPA